MAVLWGSIMFIMLLLVAMGVVIAHCEFEERVGPVLAYCISAPMMTALITIVIVAAGGNL